jgi:hypothetical protein
MKKILKIVVGIVVLALVAIQLIRPERTNPVADPQLAVDKQMFVPPQVLAILERSCYDCHSNQTRWPWYSNIAPVSWLVAKDVSNGRRRVNFSEWGSYNQKRRATKLGDISDEVDRGDMPDSKYLLIHRDAVLSAAEKDILVAWAGGAADSLKALGEGPSH